MTVVPIVIGAKSYVRYFEKDAGTLNVTMRLEVIQKAALLVTAGLLRNVLAIYANVRTPLGQNIFQIN